MKIFHKSSPIVNETIVETYYVDVNNNIYKDTRTKFKKALNYILKFTMSAVLLSRHGIFVILMRTKGPSNSFKERTRIIEEIYRWTYLGSSLLINFLFEFANDEAVVS